ncbi:MAG: exonuclease SbcCD subunit D [Chloroflexota bacterium]
MKILHFADLHLGVETYGHINPESGLSTRLEDCLHALDKLADFAIEERVDLVLFCGDAYKSREPSQTQQRELAKRIRRLSENSIPIFILVGNHDLPNAFGRATSTEIFSTLSVKNVHVASRPDVHLIPTAGGNIQVVSLPWPRRNALLSKEETKNLNFRQMLDTLQQKLTGVIAAEAAKLDPSLPAVLAAHVWVKDARVGSEDSMTLGNEPQLLLSNVALPAFDYVALGHIHRHQVLGENPPVVYAGSLERFDFGDETDEKGFYLVEIGEDPATGRRKTSYEFHPLSSRRFLTVKVALREDDLDPTATVLREISKHDVRDAVVRVNLSLPVALEGQLRDGEVRRSLEDSYHAIVTRETQRDTRLRLGSYQEEDITPLKALEEWLKVKDVPAERARVLLEYGRKLIEEKQSPPGIGPPPAG